MKNSIQRVRCKHADRLVQYSEKTRCFSGDSTSGSKYILSSVSQNLLHPKPRAFLWVNSASSLLYKTSPDLSRGEESSAGHRFSVLSTFSSLHIVGQATSLSLEKLHSTLSGLNTLPGLAHAIKNPLLRSKIIYSDRLRREHSRTLSEKIRHFI